MLRLDGEYVYDNLRGYAGHRVEDQLDVMVHEQDPGAVELEHFEAWYRADAQAWLVLGEQPIAPSLLMELYRPEFEVHARRRLCRIEWSEVRDFQGPYMFKGRFRCEGRYQG